MTIESGDLNNLLYEEEEQAIQDFDWTSHYEAIERKESYFQDKYLEWYLNHKDNKDESNSSY